jgi:hypothetical protein
MRNRKGGGGEDEGFYGADGKDKVGAGLFLIPNHFVGLHDLPSYLLCLSSFSTASTISLFPVLPAI